MKTLRRYTEWLMLPLAILLFYFIPYVIQWIDPTAGVHDIGKLQTPFLALVILYIGIFAVWLGLRVSVPDVYRALNNYLTDNKDLTPWQRGIFSLSFYAVLVVSYALIVLAIA